MGEVGRGLLWFTALRSPSTPPARPPCAAPSPTRTPWCAWRTCTVYGVWCTADPPAQKRSALHMAHSGCVSDAANRVACFVRALLALPFARGCMPVAIASHRPWRDGPPGAGLPQLQAVGVNWTLCAVVLRGVLWCTMLYRHGLQCCNMVCRVATWCAVLQHGVPCCNMVCRVAT